MGRTYGQDGLILRAAGKLKMDRYGLVSGDCRFTFPRNGWEHLPDYGMEHPYASFCHLENKVVTFTPGFWTLDGSFVGSEKEETERVYALRRNTQREPLETHEKFVTALGGKPSAPLNGAIFLDETGHPTSDDKLGVFDRFRILLPDGKKNPYAGTEAYLAPTNTTWAARWSARTKPGAGTDVGKIDANPTGSPPDYGDEFSWLYTGMGYEQRGKSYTVDEEWLLGMWIPAIYGGGA